MGFIDCSDCDRLRAEYRRVTRSELDLSIELEKAAMKNESDRLAELRSLLNAVGLARDGACRSVLEHEKQHVSRETRLKKDNRASAAQSGH